MAIHEKSLIRPENIKVQDNVVVDGIDVSGHWSTFIETRVVKDYNENLQAEIGALPGGEYIHRCWQCGSCTNACTVNALNPRFNPRYWIYLIRMGYESELLRDKDIIWQCVSCNKCTNICPREVWPEGVMKATAHWIEKKGFGPKTHSTIFDEVFTEQVLKTGKIEEGRTIRSFFWRTGQSQFQDWFMAVVKSIMLKLPVHMMLNMGWETLFPPKTKNWAKTRIALEEYLKEKDEKRHHALGLDSLVHMAKAEVQPQRHAAE
jgi:heterodisulfide reductase subunit C